MLQSGHVLRGKIRFVDGTMPEYDRPYLVVDVSGEQVSVLNASSVTKEKLHKLTFLSNYNIQQYDPPFKAPTFIKLDSLRKLSIDEAQGLSLWGGGQPLNAADMAEIKKRMQAFCS